MADQTAAQRAQMPTGPNPVLERRSVEKGNSNLLKYLQPGISVLDVGCATGAITRSIAQKVGSTGYVLGIDPNPHLIEQARQAGSSPGLAYQQADIHSFNTHQRFELVTCARTLQWLAHPQEALAKMKRLVKPGGCLAVLDFNHEKLSWRPQPPPAMQQFYDAFLAWRRDAGFDNAIADHLHGLMTSIGFENIQVENQSETTQRTDADFAQSSRLWSEVAELRGPQLVKAGYLTEQDRLCAIAEYDEWIATVGETMTVYLLAVEARQVL